MESEGKNFVSEPALGTGEVLSETVNPGRLDDEIVSGWRPGSDCTLEDRMKALVKLLLVVFGLTASVRAQESSPTPNTEGVDFEPRQSMKYRSEIDVEKLIAQARQELEHDDPEAYKVFLLAVGLGLRRKEIDLLEWPSFRWNENTVRIEPTRYFHPKSEDSIADLPVDPELMDVFRKYHAGTKGSFVIRSRRPPLPPRPHQYFRCDPIFDRLVVWLRKDGLHGNKPLHTLRKEYGSLLTRTYGIHAASRALRHADLRTTSEHYSDSTARATPGVGRLLVD
jgi:integrase